MVLPQVREAFETMSVMKNNHKRAKDLLDRWRQSPIFERNNKSSPVDDFDQVPSTPRTLWNTANRSHHRL
jgi:hypothetical protein